MSIERPHVVIAGGGASGVLLAAVLLPRGVAVTILEPNARLGLGVAYATTNPLHLLNAPNRRMSGFADRPNDFIDWLAAHGAGADPNGFARRDAFGSYVGDLVRTMHENAANPLVHVRARAVDVALSPDGVRAICDDGTSIEGSAFVLATGNPPPRRWSLIPDELEHDRGYFASIWMDGAAEPADPAETVVLLGTGLTAIDAVFALRAGGHRGRIVMVSRRGLLPQEHRPPEPVPSIDLEPRSMRATIGAFRRRTRAVEEIGWRALIDAHRGSTNAQWKTWNEREQRQFMQHALPFWNTHRHRVAPLAARSFAELREGGVVESLAGKIDAIVPDGKNIRIDVRLRGTDERVQIVAGRLINCSGPDPDPLRSPNALVQRLLARGLLTPREVGVGIADDGALIDARGACSQAIYTLGPVRYGSLLETTAIPEIREQAAALADVLAFRGVESVS